MTISEGASFVRTTLRGGTGKRGLREAMTVDDNPLIHPPDYARYLIGKANYL